MSSKSAPDTTPPDEEADLSPPKEDSSGDDVSSDSGSSSSGTDTSGKASAPADEDSAPSDSGSTRTGKGNAKGQTGRSGNSGSSSNTSSNNNNDDGDNGGDNSGGDDNGARSSGKRTDGGDDNGANNSSGRGKGKGNNNNNNANDRNANPSSNVRQADDSTTEDDVDDSAPDTEDDPSSAGSTEDDDSDTSNPSGDVADDSVESPQDDVPQVASGDKGGISAGVVIGAMLFGTILVVTLIVCIVRRRTSVMRNRQARKSYRLNDDDNDLFTVGQPYYEENGRFKRGTLTEPSAAAARPTSLYIDELEPAGGGYMPPTNPDMGYAPTHYQNGPYSPYTSPPPSAPPYAPPVSLRPMSRFGVPSPVRIQSPSPFPPEYTSRPTTPYNADHFVVDNGGFSRQNYGAPYKC